EPRAHRASDAHRKRGALAVWRPACAAGRILGNAYPREFEEHVDSAARTNRSRRARVSIYACAGGVDWRAVRISARIPRVLFARLERRVERRHIGRWRRSGPEQDQKLAGDFRGGALADAAGNGRACGEKPGAFTE